MTLPPPIPRFLVLLLLLLAAVPAQAQEVRVHVSVDSVTVGERFLLSLSAEHGYAAEPVFPSDSAAFGDLHIIERRTRVTRALSSSIRVDSVVYEVAAFAVDSAYVPPLPVVFRTPREDTLSAASAPLFIPIISLVPEDAEGVRDLAPLASFPSPLWPWILLAIAVALAAAALYYAWRKKQQPEEASPTPTAVPEMPPYEEAIHRLKTLEVSPPTDLDAVKPYYVEMTEAVRTYLSRRLGVHALERTTRELMVALRGQGVVPEDDRLRLRSVLEQADMVKFADAHPSADKSRRAVETAEEVVHAVEGLVRQREAQEAARRNQATASAEA